MKVRFNKIMPFLSELLPSFYVGLSIFFISLPFMYVDKLKNIFFDIVKSLIPDTKQFIAFGILYFVILLIFGIFRYLLKKFKSNKIIKVFNRFSTHVLENISQPCKGFYQGCSGLLLGGGLIGYVDHLSGSKVLLMLFYSLIFAIVPAFMRQINVN